MTHNASNGAPAPERTPQSSDGEERLGIVSGDRLCVQCGFNLHGQTITREPHYRMVSVRCPECSALASLQEYPVLGRWGPRFGVVLALGWLLVALAVTFFTGLTLYFASEIAAGVTTSPAAKQIGQAFAEYSKSEPQDMTEFVESGVLEPTYDFEGWDMADIWVGREWLRAQDTAALTRGYRDNPTYWTRMLVSVIPPLLIGAAWGVAWSIILLHRRKARGLIVTGLIVGLCVPLVVLSHWGSSSEWDGFGPWSSYSWSDDVYTRSIAARELGLGPALFALTTGYVGIWLGLCFGRKLVRGVVRLLLPPNLRGSLAVLWHVDGLPSPPVRGAFWIRG